MVLRYAFGFLSLVFVFAANARPQYLNSVRGKTGASLPNSCNTCHSRTSLALNPFGKDYHQIFVFSKTSEDIEVKWKRLFDLDSDGDLMPNGEELSQNRNPGVAEKAALE